MIKVSGILVAILLAAVLVAWLKVRGPDISYADLENKYADAASRFVDLPGAFHVHYRDEGTPGAPLLVLLHGYGDSFTSWEGWVQALASKYHLISLDFPGHGLTRAPAGTILGGESLADFVENFAAQLNLPKFAVAGNSMGGAVAWQLAVRHPNRVNALILVDAAGFPNVKPPGAIPLAFRILRYPAGRALLRNIDNSPFIREGLKTDVYDKGLISDFVVQRWADFQRAPGHRAILMNLNVAAQSHATPALLASIKAPTLILWGEADPLLEPASAQKFGAAIAGSRVIVYPKVGHLPQIEIPQRSADDAAGFLASVKGA